MAKWYLIEGEDDWCDAIDTGQCNIVIRAELDLEDVAVASKEVADIVQELLNENT